jgi:hypothetical protein
LGIVAKFPLARLGRPAARPAGSRRDSLGYRMKV